MAKLPSLPYDLIKNIRGEAPTVIAGFLNVVIFWIDRGIKEPLPEDRIRRLSLLPSNVWALSGKSVIEHLDAFWGPFIEHWKRKEHISGKYSQNAVKARRELRLRRELNKKIISPIQQPLRDEMQALSRQPFRLPQSDFSRHSQERAVPEQAIEDDNLPMQAYSLQQSFQSNGGRDGHFTSAPQQAPWPIINQKSREAEKKPKHGMLTDKGVLYDRNFLPT